MATIYTEEGYFVIAKLAQKETFAGIDADGIDVVMIFIGTRMFFITFAIKIAIIIY